MITYQWKYNGYLQDNNITILSFLFSEIETLFNLLSSPVSVKNNELNFKL